MSQQGSALQSQITNVKPTILGIPWKARLTDYLIAAFLPVMIFTFWQSLGLYGKIDPLFFPTPLQILDAILNLILSGELFYELAVSMGRASLGVLSGGGLGLLLGIIVGLSYRTERILDPSLQILRLMPSIAIAPLIILWFGFGETSKIIIIAFGSFFPLYLNTFQSIRGVDKKLIEVSRILEFNRFKQIISLVLPASLPGIFSGMRMSLAYGWLALVVAETLGSQAGIGYLMIHAQANSQTEVVFVGVIIFAVMGKLIDVFVVFFEKRWLRWRNSYQG